MEFLFGEKKKLNSDSIHFRRVASVIDYIKACYAILGNCSAEEHVEVSEYYASDDDTREPESLDKHVKFCTLLETIDLRVAISDVVRCFAAAFLAGGALRSEYSEIEARSMAPVLHRFSACSHESQSCSNCSAQIYEISMTYCDDLSFAARLCRILFESAYSSKPSRFRRIASALKEILEYSADLRKAYYYKFDDELPKPSSDYSKTHKSGNGLQTPHYSSWQEEARIVGEIFPGRLVVRPRVEFGDYSKVENSRSCAKHYIRSESHSPGLFTVECCCKHPKLIGVSIMDACEGVSTALSVILLRFKTMPRTCFYANACNLLNSVTVRLPRVHNKTRFVCDRFHYRGHECYSVHEPDSYPSNQAHSTSGAEFFEQAMVVVEKPRTLSKS